MKETRKPVRRPRTPAAGKPAAKPAAKSATRPAATPTPAKGKAAVRKKTVAVPLPAKQPLPGDDRETRIRVVAYFRAERRGFVPGYELEDWLAAEAEVSAATESRGNHQKSIK